MEGAARCAPTCSRSRSGSRRRASSGCGPGSRAAWRSRPCASCSALPADATIELADTGYDRRTAPGECRRGARRGVPAAARGPRRAPRGRARPARARRRPPRLPPQLDVESRVYGDDAEARLEPGDPTGPSPSPSRSTSSTAASAAPRSAAARAVLDELTRSDRRDAARRRARRSRPPICDSRRRARAARWPARRSARRRRPSTWSSTQYRGGAADDHALPRGRDGADPGAAPRASGASSTDRAAVEVRRAIGSRSPAPMRRRQAGRRRGCERRAHGRLPRARARRRPVRGRRVRAGRVASRRVAPPAAASGAAPATAGRADACAGHRGGRRHRAVAAPGGGRGAGDGARPAVAADVGDRVAAGAPLVTLDDGDFAARFTRAQSAVRARARLPRAAGRDGGAARGGGGRVSRGQGRDRAHADPVPIDGVVAERAVEPGDLAWPGRAAPRRARPRGAAPRGRRCARA